MLTELMVKALDPVVDDALISMMKKDYPDNNFLMATIFEKLTLRAVMEAAMRAELGTELSRPLGSPVVLSPWKEILINPRQLFDLPTYDYKSISTQTVIGKKAKRPLVLDIPIMITAMSYGGSLSLQMKMALAKGAALAGTCTNTGESTVTNEERDCARFLVGQYNRGGWLSSEDNLKRVDAIEVQFGQGAYGGAVESSVKAKDIGRHLKNAWHVKDGADATVYSRMPQCNSPEDIISLVNGLKEKYDVPVGIKIAGSDYIEEDLKVIAGTNADFITIDGSEGGTAAAPPTLEDNVGLPTLHSLVRAADWISQNNLKDKLSLIIAGGLTTPGHFLKALALGADAVYIGSIALVAALQTQMAAALPQHPASQLVLYTGKLIDKLDMDKAAHHLKNFLDSCIAEMKLTVQAVGKNDINNLDKSDLVTVNKELAEFLGIRYGASHRIKH